MGNGFCNFQVVCLMHSIFPSDETVDKVQRMFPKIWNVPWKIETCHEHSCISNAGSACRSLFYAHLLRQENQFRKSWVGAKLDMRYTMHYTFWWASTELAWLKAYWEDCVAHHKCCTTSLMFCCRQVNYQSVSNNHVAWSCCFTNFQYSHTKGHQPGCKDIKLNQYSTTHHHQSKPARAESKHKQQLGILCVSMPFNVKELTNNKMRQDIWSLKIKSW